MKNTTTLAILPLVLASTVAGAWAGSINVAGPWNEFSFQDPGTMTMGCQPKDVNGLFCQASSAGNSQFADAPAWTFSAATSQLLSVTDAFKVGDQFQVFDFGKLLGATSVVAASGLDCGSDPAVCFADVRVSHGKFLLSSGNHSVTITTVATPSIAGAAYFRVDPQTAVVTPEPATGSMLIGSALIGLSLALRRKRV